MGFYSNIDCAQLHQGYSGSFDQSKGTAQVVLRCTRENLAALITDVVGLKRSHPDFPALRAKTASPAPELTDYSVDGQQILYPYFQVTVSYETPDPNEDPDSEAVFQETLEPNVEFRILNHRVFQWEDGTPLREEEAPGRLEPSLAINRTWSKVPGPLPDALLDYAGHVNATDYFSRRLRRRFRKETLLYVPPVLSQAITMTQTEAWNVQMKFLWKPAGWNTYFRGDTGTYQRIEVGATGNTFNSYPLADVGSLMVN